ncbi:DUF4381 domain-containing protein [Moritella viscosa]|uniref:DUF4381 domain-containing protein n=1 Tax=Moritella viscosa TaxID=80854 RepID=A0ABY1HCY2_9GAMM|nr:DUF4381 domain-containing protein [Moritella viscosa]SGY86011.1 Putative uncharacterized protein [Moritella viscosa]SGY87307.1 Putative uncharacterized protein [Moritella viscosa]SGY87325.1 Putative uncharacterized protein [Moritella viscosa]SGY89365.1 Putative uncharacterized protein [Moritella viscosa]SHO24871.1 Putative uncharacterized protein [Moritella viscosa]
MDPLAQLKDIHLPAPVSTWPLSLYWWLAIIAVLLIIGLAIYAVFRYIEKSKLTRLALAELTQLQQQGCKVNDLHHLLKRIVLASFPRETAASLHGKSWLSFLDQQASSKKRVFTEFSNNSASWILDLYSAKPNMIAESSHFETCQNWIKRTPLMPVEKQ